MASKYSLCLYGTSIEELQIGDTLSGSIANLTGGTGGSIPYQSAGNTTAFLSPGTSGYIFTSGGTGAPTWTSVTGTGSVVLSTNPVFPSSSTIQGDFSNATFANRTLFQTSTTNATTGVYAVPNGTSTAASWQALNNANPTNASKILIATNGTTDVQLVSGVNGTGTYLPLSIYNNGAGIFVFGTAGQFGIGPLASVSYGTSGQALLSGGPSAPPTWGTAGISTGKSIAMAMIFGF